MEAVCVLGCSALAWMAAFVLTADGDMGGGGSRALHVGRALRRWCVQLVETLAATGVVARLASRPTVGALCDATCETMTRRGCPGVTRERACATLAIVVGIASLVCALSARSPIGLLVVPMACLVGIPAWDASRRRRLAQELSSEMPGVFRALAMALGSGETLAQAIEYVGVNETGPAGRTFMRAALRMRCGSPAADALKGISEELDAPGVGLLVTALLISQRTGSPLRGLFEYSAELVERTREFERMLAVKTAQVRLSVRVVCMLPVVLLLGLSLLSVDFRHGLMTTTGMASTAIAALMDVCALAIIRRILRGVL